MNRTRFTRNGAAGGRRVVGACVVGELSCACRRAVVARGVQVGGHDDRGFATLVSDETAILVDARVKRLQSVVTCPLSEISRCLLARRNARARS